MCDIICDNNAWNFVIFQAQKNQRSQQCKKRSARSQPRELTIALVSKAKGTKRFRRNSWLSLAGSRGRGIACETPTRALGRKRPSNLTPSPLRSEKEIKRKSTASTFPSPNSHPAGLQPQLLKRMASNSSKRQWWAIQLGRQMDLDSRMVQLTIRILARQTTL